MPLVCVGLLTAKFMSISTLEIAKAEGLDEFVETEDSSPELVEYLTTRGSRTVSNDFPEINVFLIQRIGADFALAVPMPYIRAYKVQTWNTSVSSGVQPP